MVSAPGLLGVFLSALTFAWLTIYATVISTAGRLLRASRARRAIEAVSGTVLIGLGARVAADAR
jgi:threonine/homoserine/homoserine lactone efflux protein